MHPSSESGRCHEAARILAGLAADGLCGRAEVLAALLHATMAPPSPPSTEPIHVDHRDEAASRPSASARAKAVVAIRTAFRPLLASRAPRRTLYDAARTLGHPTLQPHEIKAIAVEEIARHLRAQRRQHPIATPASTTPSARMNSK